MSDPEFSPDDAIRKLCDWGRQTVLSTMSVRARESGIDLEPSEAYKEMEVVAQHLWEAAFNECPKPVQAHDILFHYSRRVLNWSASHRGIKPGGGKPE
jgi:hypothetical protein